MYLTRYQTAEGPRWAQDGYLLPAGLGLDLLLRLPMGAMLDLLGTLPKDEPAVGALLAPIEPAQEVWAGGVTYLRSREAREAESATADIYTKVYNAVRPELFFKAIGWRVAGSGGTIRVRKDSQWNVPEPEMVLVINRGGQIVGYCAGNDVSSRDIEGENPLYLPQAKVYNGSCALGPGIWIGDADGLRNLPIRLEVLREEALAFSGQASTADMKRGLAELADYLTCEIDFPAGTFLMTGTCIVPPPDFSLQPGDMVRVGVGALVLENQVRA